jgi:hypothetical protein
MHTKYSENMKDRERLRRRCEDNIKRDIKEIGLRVWDWIHQDQVTEQRRALANKVMKLLDKLKAGNLLNISHR